jgi:hypothetical protein
VVLVVYSYGILMIQKSKVYLELQINCLQNYIIYKFYDRNHNVKALFCYNIYKIYKIFETTLYVYIFSNQSNYNCINI